MYKSFNMFFENIWQTWLKIWYSMDGTCWDSSDLGLDTVDLWDSPWVKVGHWDTETLVMGLETVDLWDSQLVKVGHWDTETHIKN